MAVLKPETVPTQTEWERVTNVAKIQVLIKKVGYEAITLAAPYF